MANATERHDQIYPVLTAAQIETARRFASGPEQTFAPNELIYDFGVRDVPAWLILDGSVTAFRRSGIGAEATIASYAPGQITGETNQLSGHATLAAVRAGDAGAVALPFDAAHLRALIIGSADVGETMMRAFILRRVALIEAGQSGGAGSVLVGERNAADVVRLSGFLTRNGYPHMVLATCEAEGRELVQRLGVHDDDLPLMICPNGTVLKHPTDHEAATCLGILPELPAGKVYDVAVVGAGPAGLATAVYAASEGLSVLVCDTRAFGGQAGASSRIENYLGFPTGISGLALAGRAFNQATKFGAELAIPLAVDRLHCGDGGDQGGFTLDFSDGQSVRARTVVVASGAQYRRPDIANFDEVEGSGVSYWASPIEAKLCEGEEIALVGGGNSAGQAVVFLAPYVRTLHLVARRPLAQTMSRYLIDRIEALPNVEYHIGCEIDAIEGSRATGVTGAVFADRASGATKRHDFRHVFLFIGADPNTRWLDGCVALDNRGFVLTGEAAGAGVRSPLETSRPGIFAAGDVRGGSTKRVAAAVGEGAAVVAQIHAYLAALDQDSTAVTEQRVPAST
ncbi:MAG: FAD-dependent oxidoreductase [Sphingomonas sp.]|uniref:FAD-dependent oxidoreductase n=1 Tax=Sphingomonas sp. TaxID=28214 RepID=UPI001AD5886D|nr:FAD-dependent oxidoreductase [Sphingomonas sp.]MBN8813869.1 FAD-dependent oxidoreductase [Sphingomonas sp.]